MFFEAHRAALLIAAKFIFATYKIKYFAFIAKIKLFGIS